MWVGFVQILWHLWKGPEPRTSSQPTHTHTQENTNVPSKCRKEGAYSWKPWVQLHLRWSILGNRKVKCPEWRLSQLGWVGVLLSSCFSDSLTLWFQHLSIVLGSEEPFLQSSKQLKCLLVLHPAPHLCAWVLSHAPCQEDLFREMEEGMGLKIKSPCVYFCWSVSVFHVPSPRWGWTQMEKRDRITGFSDYLFLSTLHTSRF